MKTTCPKCHAEYDIADKPILEYIQRNKNFRRKCAQLIGQLGAIMQSAAMTPEERSERARLAVAAREEKRSQNKTGFSQPVKPQQKNSP